MTSVVRMLLVALPGMLPLIAAAEDEPVGIDTVVVTASRLPAAASQVTQSLQIITREEIERRQPINVTELLRQVIGANIIQQGGRGGVTSIVLRGGEANFTVVLIDGVKVNDPTNTRGGSYDFSNLDIASIERIEIVRAPMSAVYGSDALAGVINIITRRDAAESSVAVELGDHGFGSIAAAIGAELGAVRVSLDLHALEDRGDIEGAHYEDRGLNAQLHLPFADRSEVGLSLRYQDSSSTAFPEESGGPLFAVLREIDRRQTDEAHLRLYLSHVLGSAWVTDAAYNHYRRNELFASPGIAPGVFAGVPPNAGDAEFRRNQFVVSAGRSLSDRFAFLAGAEWQTEDGSSVGTIDIGFPLPTNFRLERDTLSLFSEASLVAGPVAFHAGLRWDDPDGVNAETSARLGAVVEHADGSGEWRFNWGQGFKAPSFFALAHPLVGNPDLRSETATSIDLAYRHELEAEGSHIAVSLYRTEYEDLIDFDPVLFTSVNRDEVVAKGVEVSTSIQVHQALVVSAHLGWQEAEISNSSARLRGRPEWRAGAVVDWQLGDRWRLVTSLLLLDEFWEVSIPTGGRFLDGYERLDLALSYQFNPNLRIGFAVDNLLDESYQEAVGFPATGRRGRINATYRF